MRNSETGLAAGVALLTPLPTRPLHKIKKGKPVLGLRTKTAKSVPHEKWLPGWKFDS